MRSVVTYRGRMVGDGAQRAKDAVRVGVVIDAVDDERRLSEEEPGEESDHGSTVPAGT